MNTYIPRGSSVYIICTATGQDQSPVWSITLANSQNSLQFSDHTEAVLNNLGFYESLHTDPTTIQLLINGSRNNVNQTIIKCIYIQGLRTPTLYETVLVVYGKCLIRNYCW